MMTKRQVLLLILAIIAVAGAVMTLLWTRRMQQVITTPVSDYELVEPNVAQTGNTEQPSDVLQADFDALLSGDAISEMYDGTTDYGFTTDQE